MKRWIQRTLITAASVAALAGGLAAYAQQTHRHGMGTATAEDIAKWRGKALDRATRELQLDDTQKMRLGQLFDKLNEQRTALMGASDPRTAMQAVIGGDRFDRNLAASLLAEKTDAVRQKGPEVIGAAADFFDSLRPDQQAKVREFLAHRHEHPHPRG
jgi:Spy/CpxP family protein refolding chaperone